MAIFSLAWQSLVNRRFTAMLTVISIALSVTLLGDWTNRDPVITRVLRKYGRSGVPFYAVYPAGRLDDVIVLMLPLVNPDGGEVRRRTNEAGYDMNRDYLKLESQEIQALVTQVMNEWTPDIHIDGHHGGSVPYVITYQGTLNPAADAELRAYPYEHIFPMIREAARAGSRFEGPSTRTRCMLPR